jgi:hypothetical protein
LPFVHPSCRFKDYGLLQQGSAVKAGQFSDGYGGEECVCNILVYWLDRIKNPTGLELREFDHAIVFQVALMVKNV